MRFLCGEFSQRFVTFASPRYTPPGLSRIHSFILIGIDAILCEVEVDVAARLEKTTSWASPRRL